MHESLPSISERGRQMPASPIRRLTPLADEARRRGVHIYHLNIGQPDLPTPAAMRERLTAVPEVLAYTPSGGTPEYLEVLAGYYARLGISLREGELLATTGGSEALLFSFMACADSGDEAIVVEPFYTNYAAFARMAGVKLIPLTSRAEDGFHLPPRDAWEKVVTPKTKMVVICNPNNPTGTVYTRQELEMVADFCQTHNLFLVSDEVYREFVYDGNKAVSALALPGLEPRVIVADSLSKRYSACGIRLGSIATRNRDVHAACLRMAQGRLSPPGLAQLAALGTADVSSDYIDGVIAEYQRRRDLLYQGLSTIPGVLLRKPEGAFYFVARLPIDDCDSFARFLLSDFSLDGATVMVAPAEGFYATPGLGKDEVRIAYVLKEADLIASIRVFRAALEAYKARARG